MKVTCNRKGGVTLPRVLSKTEKGKSQYEPLRLKHGVNEVDADHFEASCEAANPQWIEAIAGPDKHGTPGLRVIDGDSPFDDSDHPMTAAEKIAVIKAATSLDELDALSKDEDRSTVQKAIDKRESVLLSAADGDSSGSED